MDNCMKNTPKLEKSIPKLTGVYLFKDKNGTIIYIGKAKNLQKRVASYFQKYSSDWKMKLLLDEYSDIDFILTPTEMESLLLEAQLIQQYKPKFNVLLKEGQPFLYIVFTKIPPYIELVRNKQKRGIYFGPFLQKTAARKTYQFLMQTFQLNLCNKKIENGCLDYHIGNCAGSCKSNFDHEEYMFRIQLAHDALKNNQQDFIQKIKDQMSSYSKTFEFEKAQRLNEYLQNVDLIFSTINTHFNAEKFAADIAAASTPHPLKHEETINLAYAIKEFLHLPTPINTIDCFDISHFQSSHLVGSCIRFTHGKPDKSFFRRFAIKSLTQQNDYAALQEIVQRRYKSKNEYPDLIVIDGGKGQLNAVKHVLPNACIVSLAKQEEILFCKAYPEGIHLDVKTPVGKLFIALRDYAHHFAISYHRLKRKKALL